MALKHAILIEGNDFRKVDDLIMHADKTIHYAIDKNAERETTEVLHALNDLSQIIGSLRVVLEIKK